MSKDVVVVFEPFNKPSQVLIDEMLEVKVQKKPFFRVRIKPYPTHSAERLIDFYGGRISTKTMQYLEKPAAPNKRGLRILRETEFDVNDRKDHPKWSHLGIVFPSKLGRIPNFIKYMDRVDEDEKQLKNPRYWKERFPNKVLVLNHDPRKGGKLPSQEAMNRYDRIWIVHEHIFKNITQKCPNCAGQMQFTYHLFCTKCETWNRVVYPIPREHPICHGCGDKYKKIFDVHKMRCTTPECGKIKSHKRVKYIGPLTSANLQNFDFIGEYGKAMVKK